MKCKEKVNNHIPQTGISKFYKIDQMLHFNMTQSPKIKDIFFILFTYLLLYSAQKEELNNDKLL